MIFDISAPPNKERRRRHSPPQCKRILDILILVRPKKEGVLWLINSNWSSAFVGATQLKNREQNGLTLRK